MYNKVERSTRLLNKYYYYYLVSISRFFRKKCLGVQFINKLFGNVNTSRAYFIMTSAPDETSVAAPNRNPVNTIRL